DGDLFVHRYCNDFETDVDGTGQGWMVHSVNVDGSVLLHYADGALIATGNASGGQALNTLTQRFTTCAEIDGSPNLDQDVAAVLVYDRSLTEGERVAVHDYLMQRYLGTSAPNILPTFTKTTVTDLPQAHTFDMADLTGDGGEDLIYAVAGLSTGGVRKFAWC